MNIKYYLRGLGIGLVVTTLILTISHHISNPKADENNDNSTQPQATTGSVIAYTKEDKTDNKTPTDESTENQQPESSEEDSEVTIDLSGIYYGSDAADLLYEAGVIEDKYEFSDYLKENGYDTMVREGVYTFTKGDSFENLAKIIMKT